MGTTIEIVSAHACPTRVADSCGGDFLARLWQPKFIAIAESLRSDDGRLPMVRLPVRARARMSRGSQHASRCFAGYCPTTPMCQWRPPARPSADGRLSVSSCQLAA